MSHSPTDDYLPTASWENLRLRAQLLRRLRDFFTEREFLEVETPLISADTVIDRHIDPIAVDVGQVWLQTSPEFCMKRLLAAGGDAIYQIAKAFRADEQGSLHNIEFTIVEWYRVGDSMDDGIQLLDDLANKMLDRGAAERVSYRDAFEQHVGIDPHTANGEALRKAAERLCKTLPGNRNDFDHEGWLNLLLVECVETHLGRESPTILYDYPADQAALAQIRDEDPPVAERFELYVDGIELANGYHELLDANVLRERNELNNDHRAADNKARLPEASRLLSAMEHGLPPCTGVALGFDRLVMIAAGAKSISEVMAFPFGRA